MTCRLVVATTGKPAASANPRAAATPTRTPVNEPGPRVTAMRSRSEKLSPVACITEAIMGISRSAWPMLISS